MNKMLIPILFALLTAAFWGSYGPLIGNAQPPRIDGRPLGPPEGWTSFKPYVFIGLAYTVAAVIGGLGMMYVKGDTFNFGGSHFPTAKWGFLAGLVGAIGALSLTMAMVSSKGNALLVMPIVFGGAVSVTALISVLRLHAGTSISPLLWVGMGLVAVGIVLVASNTPHGHAAPVSVAPEPSVADSLPGDSLPGDAPEVSVAAAGERPVGAGQTSG